MLKTTFKDFIFSEPSVCPGFTYTGCHQDGEIYFTSNCTMAASVIGHIAMVSTFQKGAKSIASHTGSYMHDEENGLCANETQLKAYRRNLGVQFRCLKMYNNQ